MTAYYSDRMGPTLRREMERPLHLWERFPDTTRLLCAKTETYNARWSKDQAVCAWHPAYQRQEAAKASGVSGTAEVQ